MFKKKYFFQCKITEMLSFFFFFFGTNAKMFEDDKNEISDFSNPKLFVVHVVGASYLSTSW